MKTGTWEYQNNLLQAAHVLKFSIATCASIPNHVGLLGWRCFSTQIIICTIPLAQSTLSTWNTTLVTSWLALHYAATLLDSAVALWIMLSSGTVDGGAIHSWAVF